MRDDCCRLVEFLFRFEEAEEIEVTIYAGVSEVASNPGRA